jgi:DNA-binding transcriptional MerR regulator
MPILFRLLSLHLGIGFILPTMRIGELSKRAGVKVGTIRFYERRELLKSPQRTSSGYRLYVPQDVHVVRAIKQF